MRPYRMMGVTMMCGFILVGGVAAQNARTPEQVRIEAEARERQREQQQVVAAEHRRLWERYASNARDAWRSIEDLRARTRALEEQLAEIQTNDIGKRLGTEKVAFETVTGLLRWPAVTSAAITERAEALARILGAAEKALQSGATNPPPSDAQFRDIDQLFYWITDRLGRLQEHEALLAHAIENAPKVDDLAKLRTFREVSNTVMAMQRQALFDALALAKVSTREQTQKMLVDAATMAELERAKLEADRLLSEARSQIATQKLEHEQILRQRELLDRQRAAADEMRYTAAMAEIERLRKDAEVTQLKEDFAREKARENERTAIEREKLKQRCQEPQVKSRLAPFTGVGYAQPGVARGAWLTKGPVSLAALRAHGALQLTPDGVQKLLDVGNGGGAYTLHGKDEHGDRLRARWGYPNRVADLSPAQRDELIQAQRDLIELGDVLVELGMLAP